MPFLSAESILQSIAEAHIQIIILPMLPELMLVAKHALVITLNNIRQSVVSVPLVKKPPNANSHAAI